MRGTVEHATIQKAVLLFSTQLMYVAAHWTTCLTQYALLQAPTLICLSNCLNILSLGMLVPNNRD